MSWLYNTRPGEFAYPVHLPELPVTRRTLHRLGCGGLLFAQIEVVVAVPNRPEDPPNTAFRYHVPYLEAAAAAVDLAQSSHVRRRTLLTEFAAAQVEQVSAAISRYYDNLFKDAHLSIDGRPHMWLDQALGATGLSYPKLREYASPKRLADRPIFDATVLANAYSWIIPGTAQTRTAVMEDLSELATEHAVVHLPKPED